MAYNVIKGNVEFSGPTQGTIEDMVDDHTDQTIGGTKTFSQMVTASSGLSASIFYGDGSQLSGLTSSPIDTYNSSGDNRVLTSVDSTTVQGEANLLFDGSLLTVTGAISASSTISGSEFYGDATGLTNVGSANINLGQGLEDDGSNNVRIKLDTAPALARSNSGVKVDLSGLGTMTSGDLETTDTMLVSDSGVNKSITMANLTTYFGDAIPDTSPAGLNTQIQFNDGGNFGASSDLTFNSSTGLLTTVSGNFQTLEVEGQAGDKTILTLDKGENSASYVEFRNGGTKYAEIFGSSAENFKIRTTIPNSEFIIGHYTEDVITIDTNNTTFDTYKVTINQELVVTGSTTTASRIHATRVETGSYSVQSADEIILMNNSTVATASLPPITSFMVGFTVTIKRTGTGAVQVSGSDGIDTQSTIDITPQGGFMRVVAADFGGSNYGWAIIAKSGSF